MYNNESRILDKSTYPRKTIETYETVAAYYIDMFYNHLYFEAKKLRNDKTVSSITEGYKHTLNAFLQGIEDPKLYKKSLLGLHTFFIDIGFTSLTFSQCIERIIREFIPEDYYDSVTNEKKNIILRNVLNNVNKLFIVKLVDKYLGMIIDHHNEADNPRILQDEFIDMLLLEREAMYKKFLIGKTKMGNRSSDSGAAIIESMRKEIKTLCTEKHELKKININLKKIIIFKEKQLNEYKEEIAKLTDTINELNNELNENNAKRLEISVGDTKEDDFYVDKGPHDDLGKYEPYENEQVEQVERVERVEQDEQVERDERDEKEQNKNVADKNDALSAFIKETNDIEKTPEDVIDNQITEMGEIFHFDADIWE